MAHIFHRKTDTGKEPLLIDVDDYEYVGSINGNEPEIILRESQGGYIGTRQLAIGDLILAPDGPWVFCESGWQNATMFFGTKAYSVVMQQLTAMAHANDKRQSN